VNSLVNELKAHQLVLIFLCAAIGTLVSFMFFTTVQALCFGLITGVFTYSFLLSREERESNIKFTDFEQAMPREEVVEQSWPNPGHSVAEPSQPVIPVGQKPVSEAQVAHNGQGEVVSVPVVQPHANVYKRSLARCWKCSDEMYVYTWDGHHPWQLQPPPQPAPDSLQLKWSNALNAKYWANTCLKCGSPQADDLLFDERMAWEAF
jgi:hypothetical protein